MNIDTDRYRQMDGYIDRKIYKWKDRWMNNKGNHI